MKYCVFTMMFCFQSILSVFRSIGSLEKSVETCKIMLPLLEALLIIEFRCKHGIVKYFNLRYFECESVEVSPLICSHQTFNENNLKIHRQNSLRRVTPANFPALHVFTMKLFKVFIQALKKLLGNPKT